MPKKKEKEMEMTISELREYVKKHGDVNIIINLGEYVKDGEK